MTERVRVERIDIGVRQSKKFVDVYAREFTCMAAGKVAGNLDAEIAEIRGACKVNGDVKTLLLKVGGSMKVEGNVQAELIRAKGAFKVLGSVNADNLRITGATKIEKDITSKEEVSVMGFCNGKDIELMPQTKDYKRIFDGDKGLNTGGMGATLLAVNLSNGSSNSKFIGLIIKMTLL